MSRPELDAAAEDVLLLRTAGPKAIRGGMLRVGGYVSSAALIAVTSILLLRYLGVVDFGRYVTVMSLVTMAAGLSDVGLTLVGQREYVASPTTEAKRGVLADILGIRLLLTPVAVLLAAAFGVAAGYGWTLVLGILVAGSGLVLSNASRTLTLPLAVRLRLGAVTAIETVYPVVVAAGIGVLVAAGAGLLPFFAIHVAAGLAAVLLALVLVERAVLVLPRVSWSHWRPLVLEAAPLGIAILVGVIYLRVLVVMASLLTSGFQTGLFSTSYRILEIAIGIPTAMVGAAFPILARAGPADERRLAYALQMLLEVSLLLAGLLVVVLAVGADAIVRLLGGAAYDAAGPVLRIQSFALLGAFLTAVWTAGLVAIRRQSAVIATNAIALITVLVLGLSLIPWLGAKGAAIAAVAGEAVLALATLAMLVRARPGLRPQVSFSIRVGISAAAGAVCVLIPGIPSLALAALAGLVYAATALLTGAVPVDALEAIRPQRRLRDDPSGQQDP
jgi:O-antigen/teichoic acid export membrane protein